MTRILIIIHLLFIPLYSDGSLYALKGGLLAHSTGPVSSGKEEGVDIHMELLFNQKFLSAYLSLGANVNLNGDTSFLYTGLTWESRFLKDIHLGAFVGFAVHNGEIDSNKEDKRQFGMRILFRTALDIGYYLRDDVSLNFMYEHYSHAGLFITRNQGNDNVGLRLSYYF